VAAELNLHADTVEAAQADPPLCVEPTLSIREVLGLLKLERAGSVLICRGDALLGIFTERDALKLMAEGNMNLDRPIEAVMVAKPSTIKRTATMGEVIRKMARGGYRRLPIVDEQDHVVGMIKVSNVVNYFVEHFPQAVFNLPPEPDVVMPEREGA
jgi:CBS domain-containing protein